LGFDVRLGYYAQHVAESLDPNSTVINENGCLQSPSSHKTGGTKYGWVSFISGDDIKKKISVLSGAKKAELP